MVSNQPETTVHGGWIADRYGHLMGLIVGTFRTPGSGGPGSETAV